MHAAQLVMAGFGKYVVNRLSLEDHLQFLQQDPCYLDLDKRGLQPAKLQIDVLLDHPCMPLKPGLANSAKAALRVGYPITDDLKRLRSEALQVSARKTTTSEFEFQIVRWYFRLYVMARQGNVDTLDEIRNLSSYELPDIKSVIDFVKPYVLLQMPWEPLRFTVAYAATMHEFILLLITTYFWLVYSEVMSLWEPTPGTFLSASIRSGTSRIVFRCFVAIPALSAVLVAFESNLASQALANAESIYATQFFPYLNLVLATVTTLISIHIAVINALVSDKQKAA
jgi:hypothetical protein